MIPNFIKKILIIGGPGCGKTTLSNKLSTALNIPVYHLDSFQFDSNWIPTEKKYVIPIYLILLTMKNG